MSERRRLSLFRCVLYGASVLAIAGLAGAAFFYGYKVGDDKLPPHQLMERVDRKIETVRSRVFGVEKLAPKDYNSHLVRLESDVAALDDGRGHLATPLLQTGGGIASFGSDIIVLPYDGQIHAASSSRDLRRTRIVAPETGRDAYERLQSDPAFEAYNIRSGYVRYHDIITVETGSLRALVISYTEFHPGRNCYTNTLAKLDIGAEVSSIDEVQAGPSDWEILYRTKPCLPLKRRYLALEGHMAGGRMVHDGSGTIYVTSGDYHLDGMRSDPPLIAQDPQAEYGKVLAFDLTTGVARIVSMGHRNPQGITRLPGGELFVTEHGPRGGDELNRIVDGANYGWPVESLGTTYAGAGMPGSASFARHDAYAPPVFAWLPSIALSDITYLEGFHPAWDGDLIVGSLIDESLYRIRLAAGRPVYAERIEIGSRIRAVHQHADGRLVLWTDNREIIFLTGHSRSNLEASLGKFVAREGLSNELAVRLETTVMQCAECHSFDVGDHERSPSLARIYGAEIASTGYDRYTDALRQKTGRWTRENLRAFLSEPQTFAPGTKMPAQQIEDDRVLNTLSDFLESVSLQF